MKSLASVIVACVLSIATTVSCNPSLSSDNSKASYGIGMQFARDMKNRGMDIDLKAFSLAVDDVNKGTKSRITDEDIRTAFQNMTMEMMKKQKVKAEANTKVGDEFLKKNKEKPGVKVTGTGLQYRVIKEGTGVAPRPTDKVKVHYKGTLIDGTEFDSSYKRNQPAEFQLNQVIPGWTEGVQLMKTGAKYEFVIPSNLGYGPQGNQSIPGNSVLVFEVELLDVKQ